MSEIYLTNPKDKFHLVDLLRGLSAIVILIWHYHHFFWTPELGLVPDSPRQPFYSFLRPFYSDGYWAVQLFWLISGFVFSHVYSHTDTSGKEFFIRRFSRLNPLHFLTLCLIAVLQISSQKLFGYYQIIGINDLYHFFKCTLYSIFGFQVGSSFNTPFWSVSIGEGIFFLFFLTQGYIFSFGIFLSLSIIGFGATITNYGTPMWYFGMCACFFYTGVLIHYLVVKIKNNMTWWTLCCISLILFLYEYMGGQKIPFHNVEFFLFLPLLIFLVKLDLSGIFHNKQFIKFCDFISSLTYSSYLLHFPIQVLVLMVVKYYGMSQHII